MDLEFTVDSRHASAAREAAAILRSGDAEAISDTVHNRKRDVNKDGIASDRLRSIVDRIERLAADVKYMQSDIKDVYTEAKSAGFDPKVLRQLIAERKKEPAELEEQLSLLDLYKRALGM